LHALVREQAAAGKTVFYSTHLLEHAEKLCHRVGILYQGQLAMAGTLDELRQNLPPNSSLEEIYFQVTRQAPAEATAETGRAHS
jgi:ABC-2 type transport system ATP-binding protein